MFAAFCDCTRALGKIFSVSGLTHLTMYPVRCSVMGSVISAVAAEAAIVNVSNAFATVVTNFSDVDCDAKESPAEYIKWSTIMILNLIIVVGEYKLFKTAITDYQRRHLGFPLESSSISCWDSKSVKAITPSIMALGNAAALANIIHADFCSGDPAMDRLFMSTLIVFGAVCQAPFMLRNYGVLPSYGSMSDFFMAVMAALLNSMQYIGALLKGIKLSSLSSLEFVGLIAVYLITSVGTFAQYRDGLPLEINGSLAINNNNPSVRTPLLAGSDSHRAKIENFFWQKGLRGDLWKKVTMCCSVVVKDSAAWLSLERFFMVYPIPIKVVMALDTAIIAFYDIAQVARVVQAVDNAAEKQGIGHVVGGTLP